MLTPAADGNIVTHTTKRLTPKNGRFLVCLLAGGPGDRAREIRDLLAERRGVLLKYHRDYEKPREFNRPIPRDVDFIIWVRTQAAHPKFKQTVQNAKAAGVPLVKSSHKWTSIDMALRARFGLKKAPALPLEVSSTAYLRVADPTEPEPVTEVVVLPPDRVPEDPVPEPPTLDELRRAVVEKDTLVLIRELQSRMPSLGLSGILIEPTQVTLQAEKST